MRRCAVEECITILSRSNPGERCRLHEASTWRGMHADTPLVNELELTGRYHPSGLAEIDRRREERRAERERAS